MHPKWIAVIIFWAAVIAAVALPSSRAGDLVWFLIVALAVVWTTLVLSFRALKNPRALHSAFFSGRGYPRWFLRFLADDYKKRPAEPPGRHRPPAGR